jgi:NAD(P)-dependent dehydrogenase (short-subunit alcohol dehydrogenase family)
MAGWALITGASKRIGKAIALELAAQGWDIIIHYRTSVVEAKQLAEEIQDLGRSACLAEIDLSNASMTEKLIPSLAKELGGINVLINNAALFEPDKDDPDGTRHWAINAEAPRLLSKAFAQSLPKGERGVIVNLLDATPTPSSFSAYAKSKKFLSDMTLNMAKSFAPRVRVNGVAPMYVFPSPRQSDEAFQRMAGKEIVSPQQVALAVRRLIETPSASGEIVVVRTNG